MDEVLKQKARELGIRIARLEERIRDWELKRENDNSHNQKMIDLLKEALVKTKAQEQEIGK